MIVDTMWEIVPEFNEEVTNTPRCWARKVDSELYGEYVWINKHDESVYTVEVIVGTTDYKDIEVLKEFKSLASAKRWVTMTIRGRG